MDTNLPTNVVSLSRNLMLMFEIFLILCLITPAMIVALFLIGLLCLRVVVCFLKVVDEYL
jgi:hypothetical protein